MSSSSNLRQNSTIVRSDILGTRIIAEVPTGRLEDGVTAGDVLRHGFSGSTAFYMRAGATSESAANVFGVVENIQDQSAFVVIQGLIQYPETLISGATLEENFYLSSATAGQVQSYPPPTSGHISKKILQQTQVDSFNAVVVNRDGSTNVGEVQASKTSDAPIGTVLPFLYNTQGGTYEIPNGWVDGITQQFLAVSEYSEYNNQFGDLFGFEETLTLQSTTSDFTTGLIGNLVETDREVNTAVVTGVDVSAKTITIQERNYDKSTYSSGITAGSTPLFRSSDAEHNRTLIGYVSSGSLDKIATPQIVKNTSNLAEPMTIEGTYPLYFTKAAASAASPDGSGFHRHDAEQLGITSGVYYMPNGLVMGETQFHSFTDGMGVHDGVHTNPVTDYVLTPGGPAGATAIGTNYTMKVKNITAVTIPTEVTIQTLNVTHGLSAGSSANNVVTTDVAYDVQCMKNRIRDLEIRIMGAEQSCSL